MRHQITKDDVDVLKGVSTNVTNTYSNPNDLVGLIAEIQISKGGIITKDMLAKDIGGLRRGVSAVVSLDEAPDAFARIRAGEVLKVVVQP